MNTFQISYDRILQGDFSLGELNLFFVFQVNCPGCFIYGFPQMERLHQQFKSQGLKVLGLSTAFEDFEYNNASNVELLLSEQKTVGATKKAIGEVYTSTSISFPIASDRLTTGKEISTTENIELICRRLMGYENLLDNERLELHQKVKFQLQQIHHTSITFALNFLQGTPSFILCSGRHFERNCNLEILDRWFGHETEASAIARIKKYLQT